MAPTGIASLFPLAAQFSTTTGEINNLTSNWSIFMLGPGGVLWIFVIKKVGRLPCLFWSQFIGLGFVIGCTVAPNLHTFAAMRILAATFQTAPQVSGLYTITDMYPFHLQARKLNIWTLGPSKYVLALFSIFNVIPQDSSFRPSLAQVCLDLLSVKVSHGAGSMALDAYIAASFSY